MTTRLPYNYPFDSDCDSDSDFDDEQAPPMTHFIKMVYVNTVDGVVHVPKDMYIMQIVMHVGRG